MTRARDETTVGCNSKSEGKSKDRSNGKKSAQVFFILLFFCSALALAHGILNRWNLHCTNCAKILLNKWFEIHATLRNFIKRNFTTIGTVQIPMVETSMVWNTGRFFDQLLLCGTGKKKGELKNICRNYADDQLSALKFIQL